MDHQCVIADQLLSDEASRPVVGPVELLGPPAEGGEPAGPAECRAGRLPKSVVDKAGLVSNEEWQNGSYQPGDLSYVSSFSTAQDTDPPMKSFSFGFRMTGLSSLCLCLILHLSLCLILHVSLCLILHLCLRLSLGLARFPTTTTTMAVRDPFSRGLDRGI